MLHDELGQDRHDAREVQRVAAEELEVREERGVGGADGLEEGDGREGGQVAGDKLAG